MAPRKLKDSAQRELRVIAVAMALLGAWLVIQWWMCR